MGACEHSLVSFVLLAVRDISRSARHVQRVEAKAGKLEPRKRRRGRALLLCVDVGLEPTRSDEPNRDRDCACKEEEESEVAAPPAGSRAVGRSPLLGSPAERAVPLIVVHVRLDNRAASRRVLHHLQVAIGISVVVDPSAIGDVVHARAVVNRKREVRTEEEGERDEAEAVVMGLGRGGGSASELVGEEGDTL